MNLCIDIGNSNFKIAIFEDRKEIYYNKSSSFDSQLMEVLFQNYAIEYCILSSTRSLDQEWLRLLKKKLPVLQLDHHTPIPITNKYETPATLGKDRLAAAVGVFSLFPNQNAVFIDAGTCLTYNFIDAGGNFLGGNISPGLSMRLRAMHEFTSLLPLAKKQYNEALFGTNTAMALENGAVKGAIYEIQSFINQTKADFGDVNIILTGGDAILFAKHLKFKIFAFPNLVLLGLNEILRNNADGLSKLKH